jgi:TatD DNase family protein
MYWDVHCHLTDQRWGAELDDVLREATARGIRGFGMGGYEPEEWQRQLDLQQQYPKLTILPIFGLHPMWVSQRAPAELELALDLLSRWVGKARAIGEIGLDAREDYMVGWDQQMEAFRAQLELATFVQKPVVLHVVRSHTEALTVLNWHRELDFGGFVHAFYGDMLEAQQYLDFNLSLSIGGAVTHTRAERLREVVRWIPKDRFLIETDSPDQKVKNWPSSLHRPAALWNIAQTVADLRGETAEAVLSQSAANFERIMRLND